MENLPLIIRGRSIGDKELEDIRALVQKHWHQSRTEISRQIFHLWDWKQPNGWLKDRACRDLLLTLEKKGLISLPKGKTPGAKGKKNVQSQGYLIDTSVCKGSITDYSSLTFSMVRKSSKEKLWDHLVHTTWASRSLLVPISNTLPTWTAKSWPASAGVQLPGK